MLSSDPLTKHFRSSATQRAALKRLGIETVEDLFYHFPFRYEHGGTSVRTAALTPGEKVTLIGVVSKIKAKKLWKSRRTATTGVFQDGSGSVPVLWFNQPYIASYVPEGSAVKLSGVVAGKSEKPYIANPKVELLPPGSINEGLFARDSESETTPDARRGARAARAVSMNTVSATQGPRNDADGAASGSIFPVYPESRGVTSLWFYHALERVFEDGLHTRLEDPIPAAVRTRYALPDLATALISIHRPEDERHAQAARKRFAFEEIFGLQVARAIERAQNDTQLSFPIADGAAALERFLSSVPYPPTGAQRRAIDEILRDFRKDHPMARLLEGDVGAGKTLVAAAASYAAVTSRPPGRLSGTLQVAYMAPTEILAQQHFQSFISYFKDLPISIGLLTGSGCRKFPSKISREKAAEISRAQLLKWVANGEIAMVIGTHALIQKSVKFQHLALAIVDEQHRFGTRQRRELAHKGDAAPHFLSMTATPIPRTLALTVYGDLDLSVLDELPPGRAKVTTRLVSSKERGHAYGAMRMELAAGRQAYVICPRIDEPDPAKFNALQARSAKAEAKRLQEEIFPKYAVGLLHGSMRPAEKDAVMRKFERNEIQVLVSTSVVEVGVNVPNATVILIEGAERFGLAQLHQLRGRVMRSSHKPYCFLAPETKSELSLKRLRTLETSQDGFALAEADLESRGAGDLYGKKQWGVSDIGMEALRNVRLIHAARNEAQTVALNDPALAQNSALRARVAEIQAALHEE